MAIVHEIQLDGYCARFSGVGARLQLGTYGSYGIEQLHIELGESWQGLVVYANFVTADGTTPVLVPESGLVDVPPEATAKPGTGNIVLDGTSDGVRIYSVDIPYLMLKHSALTGEAPAPTPDKWQQFVAEVKEYADSAQKSAEGAAKSAELAQQAAATAGWFYVYIDPESGHLYMVRADNAPEDFDLKLNEEGELIAVYG